MSINVINLTFKMSKYKIILIFSFLVSLGGVLRSTTNYHPVLFPIAIVYAPDIFRSGCGGLLADLVRVAYRIGKQIARRCAAASGFRKHAEPASQRLRWISVDLARLLSAKSKSCRPRYFVALEKEGGEEISV